LASETIRWRYRGYGVIGLRDRVRFPHIDRGTTMEMHQVRYFLAVARVLNFTRAADECNVTQPSLTRAIKQLEAELGGDLFRRERPAAQLTELGQRMHPLLKQCYEAATGAR
jgi:DNA-binding transcriptional LysR family regulator